MPSSSSSSRATNNRVSSTRSLSICISNHGDAEGTIDCTEVPEFFCGCGIAASVVTSSTERNFGRRYISCGQKPRVCHTWLWEDQLKKYGLDLVNYCRSATIEALQEELSSYKSDAVLLGRQNALLEEDLRVKTETLDSKEADIILYQEQLCAFRRQKLLLKFVLGCFFLYQPFKLVFDDY